MHARIRLANAQTLGDTPQMQARYILPASRIYIRAAHGLCEL